MTYDHDPRAEVHPYLPTQVGSLLDVGCSTGAFGGYARERYGGEMRLVGIELDPDAAAVAGTCGAYDEVIVGGFPDLAPAERFDCVVFLDVLEHLVDPWAALAATRELLRPGGQVIASIPNVQYLPVLWGLARHSRFDYTETGVLDRTHLRFFTWKSMSDMFIQSGYEVCRCVGVNSAFDWPPYARWRRLARLARSAQWMQYVVVGAPR